MILPTVDDLQILIGGYHTSLATEGQCGLQPNDTTIFELGPKNVLGIIDMLVVEH